MQKFNENPLRASSPDRWVNGVLSDFPTFLKDHASCERKAAALAMSLIAKYPDRSLIVEPMVALAREELEHFHQVFKLMRKLGIALGQSDAKDSYVNQMIEHLRHGRDERFLDRLVLSGLIEARGQERFSLLAQALTDPLLRDFYQELAGKEAGHYKIFIQLARQYFTTSQVHEALLRLSDIEAETMIQSPLGSTLH